MIGASSRTAAALAAAALLVGAAPVLAGPFLAAPARFGEDRGNKPPAETEYRRAPDFAARDLENRVVHLSDFKGKVVLLNFWATWCPPCRAELPAIARVYNRLEKKGLVVLGVSLDDEPKEAVPGFLADFKRDKGVAIRYPVVAGDDRISSLFGGIRGIPTTFIIDRIGRIRSQHVGPPGTSDAEIEAGFRAEIEPLL